jgi:hypothetical protein
MIPDADKGIMHCFLRKGPAFQDPQRYAQHARGLRFIQVSECIGPTLRDVAQAFRQISPDLLFRHLILG